MIRKKKLVIFFFVIAIVLLLSVSIAYAALSAVLVINGNFTYNGGSIGVPYDSGIFVTGGVFEDNTGIVYGDIKHELCYHSVLGNIKYNGGMPESRWIASPRGDILHAEEYDTTTPTWADLLPEYEFAGWESHGDDSEEVVNLYAIWEKR